VIQGLRNGWLAENKLNSPQKERDDVTMDKSKAVKLLARQLPYTVPKDTWNDLDSLCEHIRSDPN